MAKKKTKPTTEEQLKLSLAIAHSAALTLRGVGEDLMRVAKTAHAVLGDTPLTRKLHSEAGALELHAANVERRLKEL